MTLRRHYAAIAADPDGQLVLAIAHRGAGGTPQIDEVSTLVVTGGAAGVAAVYRGLQDNGITVVPSQPLVGGSGADARQRAIRRVLASVVAAEGDA